MKEYIIKRLLLMSFTLFGIVMITFCVTRLAPGDPATLKLQGVKMSGQNDQKLSKKLIEDTRKLYGFDQPLLLNLRNENVRTYTYNLVKKITDADDELSRKNLSNQLLSAGTVVFPYLTEILTKPEYSYYHNTVFSIIEQITNITFSPTYSSSDKLTLWHTHISAITYIFDKNWCNRMIQNIFSTNKKMRSDASKQLISAGTAPIAQTIYTAFEFGPNRGAPLFNILAQILRKPWFIEDDFPTKKKEAIFDLWKSWWKHEKYKFTFPTPTERITRIITDTQFGKWIHMISRFDFGISYSYHIPVITLIKERLPVSLQLSIISIFLTYIIAIPLGVFSATHQHTASDKFLTIFLFILYSLPSFWIANMLILLTTGGDFPLIFPSRYLHSSDADSFTFIKWILDWIWHLVLPITCLTYGSFAYISRQMRVGMLDIIRQDFIRTARAKGLSEKVVIFRHALRNALIPIVTLLAFLLPAMLGGSVIIEEIFTIEGMGKLSFEAILNRDYPIINAIALFSAFLTLLGILLTDILYVFVDPRITFEK